MNICKACTDEELFEQLQNIFYVIQFSIKFPQEIFYRKMSNVMLKQMLKQSM